MKMFRPYLPFFWIFSGRTWRIRSDSEVYLTFDDGPTQDLTRKILSILDAYDAKATFFCVGANAEHLPDIIDEIKVRGHVIGNHTMHHDHALRTPTKTYLRSVRSAEKSTSTTLFRPPYGRLRMTQVWRLMRQYKIVMWTWLSYDFDRSIPVEEILKNASKTLRPGDILVLHDNLKVEDRVEELLPALLDLIRQRGWKCGTISA